MRHHKSNAFIDLDGIPYLLGTYMDRCNFQMVDRAMIQSGIYVDTTESMRAVIDIQIDDIRHILSRPFRQIVRSFSSL